MGLIFNKKKIESKMYIKRPIQIEKSRQTRN